jgi:hypothetical protein
MVLVNMFYTIFCMFFATTALVFIKFNPDYDNFLTGLISISSRQDHR